MVQYGATAYNTCSDQKYKYNINPINNGLQIVLSLQPYRFDYDIQALKEKYSKNIPTEAGKEENKDELEMNIAQYEK